MQAIIDWLISHGFTPYDVVLTIPMIVIWRQLTDVQTRLDDCLGSKKDGHST